MGYYSGKKDIYNFGIVDMDSGSAVITASSTTTISTNSYTGLFYHLIITTVAKADVDDLKPQILLDNQPILPLLNPVNDPFSFEEYNSALDIAGLNSAPIRLLQYAADGVCTLEVFYPQGLPFNSSCVVTVKNPDADGHSIYFNLLNTYLN